MGYIFSDETTFEDVLLSVKKQFEEELVKEKIAMHMSGYAVSYTHLDVYKRQLYGRTDR